jgi:hypothetical protein
MSVEHLYYSLKEIDTVAQFLKIKNSTFFKRSISRLIAIRVDDFIKLGFAANKQTVNLQVIRDELNALQELYKDHFKLQRDKYSAHFQHLDFASRLQNWSAINLDTASFFTEMPKEIFANFGGAAGYVQYTPLSIEPTTQALIESLNERLDVEAYPNFSNDILSLTRPNSGGILNFSPIHTKAGVLKSLELLLDYEWQMIDILAAEVELRRPFVKFFVTDLVSYVDNFFTRTDIPNTAPQYEEGFDFYLASNDGCEEGDKLVTDFKAHFRLNDHIDALRVIRNKACGHIDTSLTSQQLDALIDSVDLKRFHDFYTRLKDVFKSVCYSTIYLRHYLFNPYERIPGVEKMVALEVMSFDGQPFPDAPSRYKSPDDTDEYEIEYQKWIKSHDDDAQNYFWDCFLHSKIEERIQIAIGSPTDGYSYRYHNYRKAHRFFEEKLTSPSITIEEKTTIVKLFIRCRSGDPQTLAFILNRAYPTDLRLQVSFVRALGVLSQDRSEATLSRCDRIFRTTNVQGKCLALKAIFGIDLTARRNSNGKHSAEISNYSTYIKGAFNSSTRDFDKLCLSLGLLSDYVFGYHHLSDSLDGLYKDFFIETFVNASDNLFAPFLKDEESRERLREIQDIVRYNRFCTLVGVLADFIHNKGYEKQALTLWTLVMQKYIAFAQHDDQELHNLSVIYFRLGDFETAIDVAKFLTKKNAHKVEDNFLLLDLYRHDEKYRNEFNALKAEMLATFNLNAEERLAFENLNMKM